MSAWRGFPKRGWNGLFYYYGVMAKTLDLLEVEEVETPDGVQHKWAEELAARLVQIQDPSGSWVNPVDRCQLAKPFADPF